MELSFSTNLRLANNGQGFATLLRPTPLPQHLSFASRKKYSCKLRSRVNVSATLAEIDKKDEDVGAEDKSPKQELLACPVCFQPLIRKGPSGINLSAISRSAFKCGCCKKAFSSRDVYLDLTLASAIKQYDEVLPRGTELFRSPFVSFVYERGWRQNFAMSGFPGPDEEVKLAKEFLKPTVGGTLLDVSCGSGLFSRRFVKSNDYSSIIASDFSENMLRQCYQFIKQDPELENANIALVRADVARLPFATGTIDAVHAGAALHCWPAPLAGVAEISRILRPGGVFVATTFLSPLTDIQWDALKPLQQVAKRATANSSMNYWLEAELEDICLAAGLTDYKKIRRNNFIMLSATKPM